MAGINKVILIGRLGQDPEVRYMTDGTAVANFSIATSDEWKDKETGEKRERTEWHRIVAWRRLGEICGEYLSKGRQVYVEGRLQTRSWEDKDGNKRYTTEIVASDIQFLGGRDTGDVRDRDTGDGRDRDTGDGRDRDTGNGNRFDQTPGPSVPSEPAFPESQDDDDIPF